MMFRSSVLFLLVAMAALIFPGVTAEAEACCQASSCPAGYQTSGTIGDNQLCTKKSTEGTVTCGNIDGSLPTCTGSGSEAVKPIEVECCGVSLASSCPDGYQSSATIGDKQMCTKSTGDGNVMGACTIDGSLPTCKGSGNEAVKPIETTNVSTTESETVTTTDSSAATLRLQWTGSAVMAVVTTLWL